VFWQQSHHLPPPIKQPGTIIGAAEQRLIMRKGLWRTALKISLEDLQAVVGAANRINGKVA
jgi:hypothetical protein